MEKSLSADNTSADTSARCPRASRRGARLPGSAASVVKIAAELEAAIAPFEMTNRAAEENKLPG
jgi:hypothetical protein